MTAQERRAEALTRACTGQTLSNYPAIFQGFMAMGIPESDIKPRENVFTYEAWNALGRHVRKGQHGVKVVTFIATESGKSQEPQTETLDGMEAQQQKKAKHSIAGLGPQPCSMYPRRTRMNPEGRATGPCRRT